MLQLINVYEKMPDLLFVNIGGGSAVCKQENIWEIPYVQNEDEMAQWYSTSDIFVYPSLADNCPLVILEAMACGLAILTFETGGIPELVEHEETGYIANYKDFKDLKKGFDLLLENSKLRNEMGVKAIKRVKENFTLEIMNQRYIDLYKEIIGENNNFESL